MNIVRLFLPCVTIALGTFVLADTPAPPTTATSQPSALPATAPSAQTSLVHRGDLELTIDAQGYLEPIDPFEVRIRPKSYGGELTILAIAANGEELKKGETLLKLDPAPLKKQLAAAENALTAESATLTKAEADAKLNEQIEALALRQQQDALKEAQDEVQWWQKVDGPQMLQNNDLAVKQAQDLVNDDQDELDQLKKMYKTEELTNATADIVVKRSLRGLEQAKINLAMTQARAEKARTYHYPLAKQKVVDALVGAQYALQQLEIQQALSKVLRQTGLEAAHTANDAAAEKVADLKGDLQKLTIEAPCDGTIAYGTFAAGSFQYDARNLKVGEKVAANTVLMTLLSPGNLRAVVDLPEAKFDGLKPGTKASLTPVALPEIRLEGTCDSMPRTATASPSGAIYAQNIKLSSVDPRLVAGNKVTVHIESLLASNLLLVPASAVSNSNVWVKRPDGSEESRKVITGRSDGKSIEITEGLKEGEEVLTQAKS